MSEKKLNSIHRLVSVALALTAPVILSPKISASDILVADRLSNSVYRYSENGVLLNTVLSDNININQPVGLALSPDQTSLYVSSAQNSRVMKYSYNFVSGIATNPTIFAEGFSDNLAFPSSILFSENGNRIYVSNFSAPLVAQFNLDGSTAGPPITGEIGVKPVPGQPFNSTIAQFSGLAFAPTGELLVGGWAGFPDASYGAIGKSDAAITALTDFTGPLAEISGASGLLVKDGYLYVTSMLASSIRRINLDNGSIDAGFVVPDLPYPQGLLAMPDGESMIVGILGNQNGEGRIARYDFAGNLLGTFASSGGGGFAEATAFALVVTSLPGDFNDDGKVDSADYTVWRNNLGSAFDLNGNGNESGGSKNLVDGADYQLWKSNFGNGGPHGTVGAAVPEPSSVAFAILASVFCFITRRRVLAHQRKTTVQTVSKSNC